MPTIGSVAGRVAKKSGIHIKPSHEGRLHKNLGVPAGEPIPAKALAKAKNSSDPTVRKRATFAENAKKWNHGGSQKRETYGQVKKKVASGKM